tara:strand:- start:29 stop:487 length:459 start_codon:yes stop_codon:yes gene_type:complete
MRSDILNKNSNAKGDLLIGDGLKFDSFTAVVTLTAGAVSVSDQASINCPTGFMPMFCEIIVDTAVTAAVNIQDIGPVANPDGFIDGIAVAANSTGNKGVFACNGAGGIGGLAGSKGTETADEIRVTLSGNATGTAPADNGKVTLKFFGVAPE